MSFKGVLSFFILLFTLGCLSIPIAAMTYDFIESSEVESYDEEEVALIDSTTIELPYDYNNSPVFQEYWQINQLNTYPSNSKINKKQFIQAFDSLQAFCFPVKTHITSKFGPRWGRMHNGIDVALQVGDSVCAAFNGKVRFAANHHNGFGNLIIIRHPNGLETYYAHLSKIAVEVDQIVSAGDFIGKGGRTGRVTGPHLHFETRLKGKAINPLKFIDHKTLSLRRNT